MATLVRDIVSNEDNYLRRATGELVFFRSRSYYDAQPKSIC